MKNVKSFEEYVNTEYINENLLDRIIRGGKVFKLKGGDELEKLKEKYANRIVNGKLIKATEEPLFTIDEDGKQPLKGTKPAMKMYSDLKKKFNLTDEQAIEATIKIYKWNGFITFDPEKSNFDKTKSELEIILKPSAKRVGYNLN